MKKVVLSDGNLEYFQWVLKSLDSRIELIVADGIPLANSLKSMKISNLRMVLIQPGARSGINLLNFIRAKYEEVNRIFPGVGLGILTFEVLHPINEFLLPPRVVFLSANNVSNDIYKNLLKNEEAIKALNPVFRPFGEYQIGKKRSSPENWRLALPNFNIKHSGMLPPIAHAALKANSPVYVEISAQEALVYYDKQGIDCKRKVEDAFKQLRHDVDLVKKNLSVNMYLHLDHCSDPDLINAALDSGFDSIMADRSTGTLKENIRFVKKTKILSDAYGVPIEGEIGAIDLHGFRKKSTTLLEEAYEFIQETEVDYVGVNVGQYHSGDYGYDKALLASQKYSDISQKNSHRDQNLLNACILLDERISNRGLTEDYTIRKNLKYIIDSIIFSVKEDYQELLNTIESELSIKDSYWIKELRDIWYKENTKVAGNLSKLYSEIMSKTIKHNSKKNKSLDFDLLTELAEWLSDKKTRMVIHGGSSIEPTDYQFFNAFNIARVNLGSTPYLMFIDSIRSMGMGRYNFNSQELSSYNEESIALMQDYCKIWPEWISELPAYMQNFTNEIYYRYLIPFNQTKKIYHDK